MTEDYSNIYQFGLVSFTGILAFGLSMYKCPKFRRKTIERIFMTSDYVYDSYHHLRYDNKIRQKKLKTIEPKDMVLSNTFHVASNDENDKPKLENQLRSILNFFSRNCNISQINYNEHIFYIVHNEELDFTLDNVLSLPWLAVSLKVRTKCDDGIHEIDITDKLKQFWINGNILPFHLEYYDLWIKEFVPHFDKNQIKDLELIVIDEMGNFKNHKDVLIHPHHQSDQIDLIPFENNK